MNKTSFFLCLLLLFSTPKQIKAISPIEVAAIAGSGTAMIYLNNKLANLDEKINLIMEVERCFSRKFEDIMYRERIKQFAAKYEKTAYLEDIIKNNETLNSVKQKKVVCQILLVLNGLLCAGVITKNIFQSLWARWGPSQDPPQEIQESIRLLQDSGYQIRPPQQ